MKIKELSPEAAHWAYQDWQKNTEFCAEYTIEDWKEKLKEKGIGVDNIFYSGFSSQGDGACFTGELEPVAFIETHGLQTDYFVMYEAARFGVADTFFVLKHQGNYYHEYSVSLELGDLCNGPPSEGVLSGMPWEAYQEQYAEEINNFAKEALEVCRDYMRQIYTNLEAGYEHQFSYENFVGTCEANEWEFDEEGEFLC